MTCRRRFIFALVLLATVVLSAGRGMSQRVHEWLAHGDDAAGAVTVAADAPAHAHEHPHGAPVEPADTHHGDRHHDCTLCAALTTLAVLLLTAAIGLWLGREPAARVAVADDVSSAAFFPRLTPARGPPALA